MYLYAVCFPQGDEVHVEWQEAADLVEGPYWNQDDFQVYEHRRSAVIIGRIKHMHVGTCAAYISVVVVVFVLRFTRVLCMHSASGLVSICMCITARC